MSSYKYEQGIGSVGAYQVSGVPFLTASIVQQGDGNPPGGSGPASSEFKVSFPKVTKSVKIVNTGSAPLRIHFESLSVAPALHNESNFLIVASDLRHYHSGSPNNYISGAYMNNPLELSVKCKDLYVSSTGNGQSGFQLMAELTTISKDNMYVLSGSGINGDGRIV